MAQLIGPIAFYLCWSTFFALPGFVQAREVSWQSLPEFAHIVADVSALGKTCPPRADGPF